MSICCCSMLGSICFICLSNDDGFIENFNLISPSQPFASVLPSNTKCIPQTLNHNKTFVGILDRVQLIGCSWMLVHDWTLFVYRHSLKVEGIYEVSLDTNETLINNIISKTECLLGRDSCKTGLPECGRGQAVEVNGTEWTLSSWTAGGRVFVCDPAPFHSCHTGPDVALHSCWEL